MKFLLNILIILFVLFHTNAGISQPWYFNEIYNPNQTQSIGKDIIGTENGYFGCAFSVDSVTDYFYNVCTFILSPEGNLLSWKNFGEYGFDYYTGWYGSLIQTPDGNFATFGSRVSLITTYADGMFYQFDGLGDTMFTRIFTSEAYNHFVGRACTYTLDSGFALLGEVSVNHGYSDVFLIKTDSNANEIWRSQQGTTLDDWGHSLIQTADHGYALGTWAYIPEDRETGDPMVIKTDSLGGFEWSLNLGGPYKDDRAMICQTADSCVMVLTAYADSMYTPEYAFARINLVKIDLEGNIIWNKKYGASKPVNLISNIIPLDNGDFMACGSIRDIDDGDMLGWLFRFNENGDSIWYRDYYYYLSSNGNAMNYLYDVSFTADDGFISTGEVWTLFGPNHIQKMWVLKVDSIGCEIPNCWVGIEEEEETGGQGEEGNMRSMEIWPNPARDIVNCRWSIVDGRGDNTLVIYDMFGREIRKMSLSDTSNAIQIDVEEFLSGLYLVVLKEGNEIIGSSKLIIAR